VNVASTDLHFGIGILHNTCPLRPTAPSIPFGAVSFFTAVPRMKQVSKFKIGQMLFYHGRSSKTRCIVLAVLPPRRDSFRYRIRIPEDGEAEHVVEERELSAT
jgi:hypothetical protein